MSVIIASTIGQFRKKITDSQNYALSEDMRFFAVKWEQVGAVTRKYDAAREKGGDSFKKSDFN